MSNEYKHSAELNRMLHEAIELADDAITWVPDDPNCFELNRRFMKLNRRRMELVERAREMGVW